ncbi:FCPA [Symbiodinium necroappetens]|uniref:FCPA protein n=1 Tax=Symbiodinium necroappetens TaxID=1628268 RepID=A0A812N0Z9_9DINO|nr:FCPA [Symbiodinium necroappetens]
MTKSTPLVAGALGTALYFTSPSFVPPAAPHAATAAPENIQRSAPAGGAFGLGATAVTAAAAMGSVAAARQRVARKAEAVLEEAEPPFDPKKEPGVTLPLFYFDPLGFAKEGDREGFYQLRSAELKHGRVAMIASLGMVFQHWFRLPGFEDVPSGIQAAITPPGTFGLLAIVALGGALEFTIFKQDPEMDPGDFGDPAGFGQTYTEWKDRELNNCRMGMVSFLGIVVLIQFEEGYFAERASFDTKACYRQGTTALVKPRREECLGMDGLTMANSLNANEHLDGERGLSPKQCFICACRVDISTCQKKMAAIRMAMTKSAPLVAGRHHQRKLPATTAEPENIVSLAEEQMELWMESMAFHLRSGLKVDGSQFEELLLLKEPVRSVQTRAPLSDPRKPLARDVKPSESGSAGHEDPSAMAMKYLGAYLMAVLGGKELWVRSESPSAEDIKTILEARLAISKEVRRLVQAGGISYEDDLITKICERMEGKQAHELIKEGFGKFAACGGGGGGGGSGGAAPAAGGGGDAPAAEEKKKVEEEEEEEEMDFDLFG